LDVKYADHFVYERKRISPSMADTFEQRTIREALLGMVANHLNGGAITCGLTQQVGCELVALLSAYREEERRLFPQVYLIGPSESDLLRALAPCYGIAQVVLHGREQLVLLRPQENLLVLEVLHYRHQVSQPSALADEAPRMEVSPEELHMARTLVKASTADFDLEKYPDLYTHKLQQLIEAKVAGQELVTPSATPGPRVINLMEALRQSVARVEETNGTKKEPRKSTRRLVRKIS
jgi:hypothetical protein